MASLIIQTLCLVSFLSIVSTSQLAPFYPLQVEDKGIDVIWVGFVLGTNAAFFMLSCIVSGRYIHLIGREKGIIMGCLLIIFQNVALAYLPFCNDSDLFLWVSFMSQAVGGIGTGINSSSSVALIIANSAKVDREKNIGKVELCYGLGLLLGPIWGSIMYQLGGYMLPFASVGAIYLAFYPMIVFQLKSSEVERIKCETSFMSETSGERGSTEYNPVNTFRMFMIPRYLMNVIAQIILTATPQYLAPTLAIHLRNFGFVPSFIGLCFTIPAIIYAGLCPIVYLVVERLSKRGTILLGLCLLSVGMFFVGTSETLGLDNDPVCIMIGLAIVGVAASQIAIPGLPDMLEAIDEEGLNYDPQIVNNTLSGLFVMCTATGEFTGPMLSSVMVASYGFRVAQDIFASGIAFFALCYFLICGGCRVFKLSAKEIEDYSPSPKQSDQQPGHIELVEDKIINEFKLDQNA